MRAVPLLLLAVLVAGCMANPAVPPAPLPQVDGVMNFLHMEGCSGAMAVQSYAQGTNPVETPAGWSEDDGLSRVMMWIWACPSVGFADLERPATMLWEVANNAVPPEACLADTDEQFPWFVVNLLVDDAELVQRMRAAGLPAETVTFERTEGPTGDVWRWGDGDADSRVEWFSERGGAEGTFGPTRWLAPTPDGVVVMDLLVTHRTENIDERVAAGELGPRHRLGFDGRFLGNGALTTDGEVAMHLRQKGVDCA